MKARCTYDSQCEDLARAFLSEPSAYGVSLTSAEVDELAPRLAQDIQKAIDDFISFDVEAPRGVGPYAKADQS